MLRYYIFVLVSSMKKIIFFFLYFSWKFLIFFLKYRYFLCKMCRKNLFVVATLYTLGVFYSAMPVIVKTLYWILPTNGTYTTRFIFRLDHVLDLDKYFTLLMFIGVLGVFFLMSVWIAADGMFILCTQHVCALFEIIQ